MFQTAR